MAEACIFLSAGEASGDQYLARVATAIRERRPDVRLAGVVGTAGRDAGVEVWARSEDLAVMGFGEVVRHVPRLMQLGRCLVERASAENARLFLPVDYPGFHVRLAGRLRAIGVPTLDFIPPKTWSWARWRLRRLRDSVERCAVIFPFEVEHYRAGGVDAVFVGHPLVDAHAAALSSAEAESRKGLLVAPGSRPQELARLAPVLAEAIGQLAPDLEVRVSRAPGVDPAALSALVDAGAELVEGPLFAELRRSAAAFVCSGTATVEAALSGTPHVIVYRTGALTYAIARRLATVEHIGMANIVLGRRAFPELLQAELRCEALVHHARELSRAHGSDARARQLRDAAELRSLLGEPGCFDRVAELALERFDRAVAGVR